MPTTVKNISALSADVVSSIFPNAYGLIDAGVHQQLMLDILASSVNRVSDKLLLNLQNFNAGRGYDVGECTVLGSVIYQCVTSHTGVWNPLNFLEISGTGGLPVVLSINNTVGGYDITATDTFASLSLQDGKIAAMYSNSSSASAPRLVLDGVSFSVFLGITAATIQFDPSIMSLTHATQIEVSSDAVLVEAQHIITFSIASVDRMTIVDDAITMHSSTPLMGRDQGLTIGNNLTLSLDASQLGTTGGRMCAITGTIKDGDSAGTRTMMASDTFEYNTFSSDMAVTVTDAYTHWIQAAPLAGTNMTFTRSWALGVASGNVTFAGRLSVGQLNTVVTAFVDVAASTLAVASARFRAGVDPSNPNAGDHWFDGTNFRLRDAAIFNKNFASCLTGSTTQTIGSVPSHDFILITLSVTNAAVGDAICVGGSASAYVADIVFSAYCDVAGVVTIKATNTGGGAHVVPSSTYKVIVFKNI